MLVLVLVWRELRVAGTAIDPSLLDAQSASSILRRSSQS